MVDLWPEVMENTEVRAPVTILKEQAALLGNKTKNLVIAQVSKPIDLLVQVEERIKNNSLGSSKGKTLYHSFYLVAPALNNYQYELFTIANDINLYPVTIVYLDENIRKRSLMMKFKNSGLRRKMNFCIY